MRIAIVGAHGTGKTTLANEIAKDLAFPIVPDTAAEAFHKGFEVNENTPVENQFWILCKQLEYERQLAKAFIADKALYDNVIYARNIFNDERVLSLVEDIVLKNAQYDLLLYVPIEIDLVDDGRSMDIAFQKSIDDEYTQFLREHHLPFVTVRGSVPERLAQSKAAISAL